MWQRVGSGSGAEMVLVQAILRICELDDPAVTQLLDALDEEIQARYDEPVEEFILKPSRAFETVEQTRRT